MEKKQLIMYSVISALGFGLVIGTVLLLRSRNAPTDNLEALANPVASKPAQTGAGANKPAVKDDKGIRPFKPIESYTIQRGWKEGDPPIPAVNWPTDKEMIPNPSSTKPSYLQ